MPLDAIIAAQKAPARGEVSGVAHQDTDDLYEVGVAAALAMDTKTFLSEVAKYFARHVNRQRRAARQRNAVKFSLRLSDEEATDDVAAVSVAGDPQN